MAETERVTIPFGVVFHGAVAYPEDDRIRGGYSSHGSRAAAKKKARAAILETIDESLTTQKNHVRIRLVGCTDGTILVVRWWGTSWCYEHHGDGHSGRSAMHWDGDFDATVDAARRHAADYGGVAWESGS